MTEVCLSRLSKSFGASDVLSDITFRVPCGAIVGLVGPNGAGKTTLLRCIVGLINPTAGSVTLDGEEPQRVRERHSVIGIALGGQIAHPATPTLAALRSHTTALGLSESRADDMLNFVGLSAAGHKRIRELSLGMRQRLAIGCALLNDPRLLVLDEPLNGLDPEGVQWLTLELRALAESGTTVIVSSHLLTAIEDLADQLVGIRNGTVLFDGSLTALRESIGRRFVVSTSDDACAQEALTSLGVTCIGHKDGLSVEGHVSKAEIVRALLSVGIIFVHVEEDSRSLEELYFRKYEFGEAGNT